MQAATLPIIYKSSAFFAFCLFRDVRRHEVLYLVRVSARVCVSHGGAARAVASSLQRSRGENRGVPVYASFGLCASASNTSDATRYALSQAALEGVPVMFVRFLT